MPDTAAVHVGAILLPVDFDESNLRGARDARSLAQSFGARVVLLHVTERSHFHSSPDDELRNSTVLRTRLEAFGTSQLAGIVVEPTIASGDPAVEIAECARLKECDLIVMPTHGYGSVRRLFLGSVARRVLGSATCPVWTVTSGASRSSASAIRRVLCGVNLGAAAAKIVRWAALFANTFSASLTVLSVLPPAPPSDVPDWYVSEWNEGALAGLESRLRALVQELGVRAEILVDQGDAATTLLDVTCSQGADLLVIGRETGKDNNERPDVSTYPIVRGAPCRVVNI